MPKHGIVVLLICAVSISAQAQSSSSTRAIVNPPPTVDELLKWHEVFTYEVRYSFFKLGEVKVEIVSDTLYNGKESWYFRSTITSSGIPFVGDEKNLYSTIFTTADSSFRALAFWTDNVDENEFNSSRYTFDYEINKVYAYESEAEDAKRDTLKLVKPATAGHILFLTGRLKAGTNARIKIPVYTNLERKHVTLHHTNKKEVREYDAFDHPVATFYTEGDANFDGPFGFSGEFEAWYLAGDLRVPVEAQVDVWLGNVKIKLINYKKELR